MTFVSHVTIAGVNALTATAPNDFIWSIAYNTFKILAQGTINFTVPHNTGVADYTFSHNLERRPLVLGFMREGTVDEVRFQNNLSSASYLLFESTRVDYTKVYFELSNNHTTNDIVAHMSYMMFEIPL